MPDLLPNEPDIRVTVETSDELVTEIQGAVNAAFEAAMEFYDNPSIALAPRGKRKRHKGIVGPARRDGKRGTCGQGRRIRYPSENTARVALADAKIDQAHKPGSP